MKGSWVRKIIMQGTWVRVPLGAYLNSFSEPLDLEIRNQCDLSWKKWYQGGSQ